MHIELYKVTSTLSRVGTVTLIIRCYEMEDLPLVIVSDIEADFWHILPKKLIQLSPQI